MENIRLCVSDKTQIHLYLWLREARAGLTLKILKPKTEK